MSYEEWRDIPGYEGRYQASNFGRIRSVDRYVRGQNPYTGELFMRRLKGKVLRPSDAKSNNHYFVVLGHKANGSQVHALVALAFIGERPTGMDIRHLDGDPKNNRVDNLCYGTRTDNILDVYRVGKAWRTSTPDQIKKSQRLPARRW